MKGAEREYWNRSQGFWDIILDRDHPKHVTLLLKLGEEEEQEAAVKGAEREHGSWSHGLVDNILYGCHPQHDTLLL